MKGLVISWFFPPETSAEGLVAYKLLKASNNSYDVFSSNKAIWGYDVKTVCNSRNIVNYAFNAVNFSDWVQMCLGLYNLKHDEYDFLMTRSMPPESHLVGLSIKSHNRELLWMASFGDPLAYNPYEVTNVVKNRRMLPQFLKSRILNNPRKWVPIISKIPYLKNNILSPMLELENKVFENADLLIFPNKKQCIYSLGTNYDTLKDKTVVLPHSYDLSELNSIQIDFDDMSSNRKYTFLYTGHLDSFRNPLSIIKAVEVLLKKYPEMKNKVLFKFIGNVPDYYKNMVMIKNLYKNIVFLPPVNYDETLRQMKEADCLLHIDAEFKYDYDSNIFLASKLSDYMGCQKPILGITAKGSPAYTVLKESNNLTFQNDDYEAIAEGIKEYVDGNVSVNLESYKKYENTVIAAVLDDLVSRNCRS